MMNEEHNGYSNFPTWALVVHVDNDESLAYQLPQLAYDGDMYTVRRFCEDWILTDFPTEGPAVDIMYWGWHMIDWQQLHTHWKETYDDE